MAQKGSVGPLAVGHVKVEPMSQSGGALPFDNSIDIGDIDVSLKQPRKKQRIPRRVLHFSDGILEEYSTDEEEESAKKEPTVDPKTLNWLPWFWFYMVWLSKGMLGAADACGEKVAWWLGITSPKYQYILDEYHRIKAEELKEKMEDEMLMKSVKENKEPEVVVHDSEGDRKCVQEAKPNLKPGNL